MAVLESFIELLHDEVKQHKSDVIRLQLSAFSANYSFSKSRLALAARVGADTIKNDN
jgi:hypothetical protein